jgi:DNA-directed RNA polymerase specialized sigma24 family protein
MVVIYGDYVSTPFKQDDTALTLYEYLDLARQSIVRHGGIYKSRMLRDEDAVSFVAEGLMKWAHKYQPSRGSVRTYMLLVGKWRVLCWLKYVRKTRHTISLSTPVQHGCQNKSLVDTIPSDSPTPLNLMVRREVYDDFMKGRQPHHIELLDLFLRGYTFSEIGRRINMSKVGVEKYIARNLYDQRYARLGR